MLESLETLDTIFIAFDFVIITVVIRYRLARRGGGAFSMTSMSSQK